VKLTYGSRYPTILDTAVISHTINTRFITRLDYHVRKDFKMLFNCIKEELHLEV